MKRAKDLAYHYAYKMKLYPSNQQKRIIAKSAGAQRAAYNAMVAANRELYGYNQLPEIARAPYANHIAYLLETKSSVAGLKNTHPYMYLDGEIDSHVVDNGIRNYRAAWNMYHKTGASPPQFHKKGSAISYTTNTYYKHGEAEYAGCSSIHLCGRGKKYIHLPKIGKIRTGCDHNRLNGLMNRKETRISSVTISRDSAGDYWASVNFASDIPFVTEPLPEVDDNSHIGIDLNLGDNDLVVTSEGEHFPNPKYLKKSEKALKKHQKGLFRKAEAAKKAGKNLDDCRNYQKEKLIVAKIHRKVARQRKAYQDWLTKHLLKNHKEIVLEDLNISGLLKNHNLAKAISDAGWGQLIQLLKQKGELYGREVSKVDPKYTSQRCHVCGHINTGTKKLSLSVRKWECPLCHTVHDRDVNAACNILEKRLSPGGYKAKSREAVLIELSRTLLLVCDSLDK